MVWLSINPDCEDRKVISSVLALASTPENAFQLFCLSVAPSRIDPAFLAECYNNAESLGFDLFAAESNQEVDTSTVFEEHHEFIEALSSAALRDLALYGSVWQGSAYDVLLTYDPATKTYEAGYDPTTGTY